MKLKTKIASLSVATVLTLTCVGNGLAEGLPFKDLDNVASRDKIIALQEKGYVKGTGDNLFLPNDIITAAEGIQLIVNTFNLNLDTIRFFKEPKATDYFAKADNNAWYANALIIASVHNLDLSNDLDPDQEWTKEEFTYYLINTMENYGNLPKINIIPKEIADNDSINIIYDGAIQRSLVYGVTKLDENGEFNPKDKISRADAAEQIYNALEYLKAHPAPAI